MIELRQVRYNDWQSFYSLFQEPDIQKELPFKKELSKFECYTWFLSIFLNMRQGLVYARVISVKNRFLGIIFLEQYNPIHQTANISFDLSKKYQGKGIGRVAVAKFCEEAFLKIKLNRINAIVRPCNLKSQNLLKSIGFTKETSLKQFVHFKGDLVDVYMYRFCKDERKAT